MEARDGEQVFRGELLHLARQARRWTQRELAEASGVSQAFVSMVEDGLRQPSDDQIAAFADALRFPPHFFRRTDPLLGAGIGEVFHRRRKSIAAKDLEQIHAWRNITTFAVRRLLRVVDWPPVDLPAWSLHVEAGTEEEAAEMLRGRWYVPDGPVRSVSALLDRVGILIIPTSFYIGEVDGVGQYPDGLPPMVFVNQMVPQDRLRFTLMHELAHLVLHQRSTLLGASPDIEDQANRMASAFLLPRHEIKPELRNLTIERLAGLKRRWRVSMAALLMRASQLETVTPAQERALWAEMGRNGWRKREPAEFDVFGEEPGRRFAELVRLHRQDLGYSDQQLAQALGLFPEDVAARIVPPAVGLRRVV